MNRLLVISLQISFIILAVALSIKASPKQLPRRATQIRAVIIGVSKYSDSLNYGNLKYAAEDATAYAKFLMSTEGGSVSKENIRLLLNEDATRLNMIDAMTEIFGSAQSEDILIFFFSGHGESTGVGNVGVLCPTDIRKKSVNGTGFRMNELYEMTSSRAKIKMTLIDACHAGLFIQDDPNVTVGAKGGQKIQKISEINSAIQKSLDAAPAGNISIMSSQGLQESKEYDHLQHGALTYYLLRGLQGEADKFLKGTKDDGDGNITVQELFGFIQDGVMRTSGNKQIPRFSNSLPLTTVVANCEPNQVYTMPISSETLGTFNKIDTVTAHTYNSRWLLKEKPAFDFKCPVQNESSYLILELTFNNPTVQKEVQFIYVQVAQYPEKIGEKGKVIYNKAFHVREGVNRCLIENYFNEKNVEIEVGYMLERKPGDPYYPYYHTSCYSPGSTIVKQAEP